MADASSATLTETPPETLAQGRRTEPYRVRDPLVEVGPDEPTAEVVLDSGVFADSRPGHRAEPRA